MNDIGKNRTELEKLGYILWMNDEKIDKEIETIQNSTTVVEKEEKIEKLNRVRNLMLIPERRAARIPQGTEVISINGDVEIFDMEKLDMDTRFGCLAYGIKVKS